MSRKPIQVRLRRLKPAISALTDSFATSPLVYHAVWNPEARFEHRLPFFSRIMHLYSCVWFFAPTFGSKCAEYAVAYTGTLNNFVRFQFYDSKHLLRRLTRTTQKCFRLQKESKWATMACRQMGGPRKSPDDDKQPWQRLLQKRVDTNK